MAYAAPAPLPSSPATDPAVDSTTAKAVSPGSSSPPAATTSSARSPKNPSLRSSQSSVSPDQVPRTRMLFRLHETLPMVMIGIFDSKDAGLEVGVPFQEFTKIRDLVVRIHTQLVFNGLCEEQSKAT